MIILLAALVMSAMPAAVQCNQNNCVELNRDIEFGKNSILFDGQQATIEDLMNNNPQFQVELWYDNWVIKAWGKTGWYLRKMDISFQLNSPLLYSLQNSNGIEHKHSLVL